MKQIKPATFLVRLMVALLAAWVFIVSGMSLIYVYFLTYPPCPSLVQQPDGYQAVTFVTADDHSLNGFWRSPQNGAVVILLGGHGATRETMLPEAEVLARHGYGVLTMDYRHCAGERATLGLREVDDLRAALEFVNNQPGVEWVSVQGFSVGGVTAIRGAAQLPEIGAVISMGNYYNMWDALNSPNAKPFSLNWQFENVISGLMWLQIRQPLDTISPSSDLAKMKDRPVLLIFGENEAVHNRAAEQFQAAAGPKELWIVNGVGHGGYLSADPEEYKLRVLGFLDRYRP
jgi:uncharacterized protein